MKTLYKYILFSATFISLFSCEKFDISDNADTFFHVKINNTELPVWVKGNTESKKLVIYINGGPGLTSIDVAHADMFGWSEILEKKFGMVYYDQRGCGNSQGNIQEESLTIAQFVDDLFAIVNVLKSQYENTSIYLMGHSFGSYIGANYLMDSVRQSKISGWVTVDGSFNFDNELQWDYKRSFLINIAKEETSNDNDLEYWSDVLTWTEINTVISSDDQKDEWREFIGNPGEKLIPLEEGQLTLGQHLSIDFSSSYNPFHAYLSKNQEIVNTTLNKEAEGKDIIADVSSITIPSLFLWGRYDDIIPIEQGFDVYNNLGSVVTAKTFVIMDKSSHEPFIGEPQKFQNSIVEFLNKQ